jgi:uncharacterized protein (TIGR02118 family)
MVKITVLYGPPTDPDAFETHYFGTHVAIADKIPGLRRNEVTKLKSLDGSPSPYFLAAELYFDSEEALGAGMASEEGQAAAADVANFATGGVTMLGGQVVKES